MMALPKTLLLCAIAFMLVGVGCPASAHDRHALNAFMADRYGEWNPAEKYWERGAKEPRYAVCAAKDIEVDGEPRQMLAICGELPDARKSHAASGYVDLYVMKRTDTGLAPVAELTGIESGSFGAPGSVTVIRLGKDFYGFEEKSGWSGQGYTNGFTSIYVPFGDTFHLALRFSSAAEDSRETCIERSIEFIPSPNSPTYVARITSSGRDQGKPVSRVYTLHYNPKKHEYIMPKDFKADIGY